MQKARQVFATIVAVLAAGCIEMPIDGSGNVVSEPREVSGFSTVSLLGSGDVIIEQGATESLTITTDDNILPYLTSQISGTQLILAVKKNTSVKPTAGINYRITVKRLNQIDLSGAGSIDAKSIRTGRLKIAISGSGTTTVAGKADHQDVVISGSGHHDSEDFSVKTATVRISGSGSVVVAVSEKLDVNVIGSGSVNYIGDPTVTQKVTGSGSVEKQ
jgi:hypothetical protein